MARPKVLRCVSWNVNGIRAVQTKGFWDWFHRFKPDVMAMQETRITDQDAPAAVPAPRGYRCYWHGARKPGYSGVATWTRAEPSSVLRGVGVEAIDSEGRVLSLDFGDWVHVNAYFPNSRREHARLGYKLAFCRAIARHCNRLRRAGKAVVVCGDFNIAHQAVDLANPRQNEDNAGFLPQERAWMSRFLGREGFVDCFRMFTAGGGHYTWWSYRPGVRRRNIGWRIDYHCVNKEASGRVKAARHLPEVGGSDHCPVELEWKT
ncbi:MAG: exodeoxyribonuclease III [Elusimicrobia bacterium]|nr:exodeoxyribonuclease III [Elusimicrobiota bacterium]